MSLDELYQDGRRQPTRLHRVSLREQFALLDELSEDVFGTGVLP